MGTSIKKPSSALAFFPPCFLIVHEIFIKHARAPQGSRSTSASKPPACCRQSSGSKSITLVNTQCWADLTGDMVVWLDQKMSPGDLHVTVQWCDLGRSGQPGPAVLAGPVWCALMPSRHMRGMAVWTKKTLFFIFPLVLYRSFSHMSWHSVSNSLPHSSLSSYQPCHAATHSPLSLILSCPSTLALTFLLTLPPQVSCESCSIEQRAWERLPRSLQWIDKKKKREI